MKVSLRVDIGEPALVPRRLGHVNLYVRDWERTFQFYSTVCGLEEVFRETPIKAGFVSSGNTHHDVGFLEARPGARIGRAGFVQTKAGIGERPEFNHFGIEMENEKQLVESYHRLIALGITIEKTTDSSGLSKSVYIRDPDRNLLQFYTDMTSDWRGFYAQGQGDRLVTGPWTPELEHNPGTTPLYTVNPVRYDAKHRAFRPMRVTGGTLVVADLARSESFYKGIGGFRPVWRSADKQAVALSARNLNRDLTLIQAEPDEPTGLRHFSFLAGTLDELLDGYRRLADFGIKAEACFDHGLCRSIYVRDPDGFLIEFYSDQVADWPSYLAQSGAWQYPIGRPWVPAATREV